MKIAVLLNLLSLLAALRTWAGVLSNDAVVGDRTLREWSAEWWKWVYSIPAAANPLLDQDGSRATNGQPTGPVFFLAGIAESPGTLHRQFVVPQGKYLFFPVRNIGSDNVDTEPPLSVEELRDGAAGIMALVTEMHASIDGIAVQNLEAHRLVSPVFSVFLQKEHDLYTYFYGHPITGLIDPIVSDGYWVMVEPLAPGNHTVIFGGTLGPPINVSIEISNSITVLPPPIERTSAAPSEVDHPLEPPTVRRQERPSPSLDVRRAVEERGREAGPKPVRKSGERTTADRGRLDRSPRPALTDKAEDQIQANLIK